MSYKLITGGVLDGNGTMIPLDLKNADYRKYLEWVAQGNVPKSADPEPVRATTITPSQQIILADGEDVATVTFSGEPGATVDYTVNGQVQSLTLDASGTDTLELTCDTPNTTLLVQAGTARAVVYAVEVPS